MISSLLDVISFVFHSAGGNTIIYAQNVIVGGDGSVNTMNVGGGWW